MRKSTRVIITTEYHAVCEVCGARIVVAVVGPTNEKTDQEIGSLVAICPRCADSGDLLTAFMFEHELRETFDGTQHTQT